MKPAAFSLSRLMEAASSAAAAKWRRQSPRPPRRHAERDRSPDAAAWRRSSARGTRFLALLPLLALPTLLQAQFSYTTNNGAITITGYTGPGGAVTIPSTVNGWPVTGIGENAFASLSDVTSVTIPGSVIRIDDQAFMKCGLTSITIPDSVASIGDYVFKACPNLSSITIPDSVTNLGNTVFCLCTSLTNAAIGNGVPNIEQAAFWGCYSLSSLTIGSSVTNIATWAFLECSALTSVTIPAGVGSIESLAFSGCLSLKAVYFLGNAPSTDPSAFNGDNATVYYLPGTAGWGSRLGGAPTALAATPVGPFRCTTNNGAITITGYGGPGGAVAIPSTANGWPVTGIGENAFASLSDVTSAMIPDSVTTIGETAFAGCSSLGGITVAANNPAFCSVAGVLFDKGQTTLIQYPAGNKALTYTIPGSVISIDDGAFMNCRLTSITIPDSVASIGNYVFSGCANLSRITIPDGVASIENYAFNGCANLSSITIPDSVVSVGNYAFNGCASLSSITIPDSVVSVGNDAFNGCANLSSITIPDSVVSVGNDAFSGCVNLSSITIPDSVTNLGSNAFGSCSSLTNVTIGNGVTSIANGEFSGFSLPSLTSVTIGNGVTSIGPATFLQCYSLATVTIGSGVTNIDDQAFSCCTSLSAINIDVNDMYYSSVDGVLFDKGQTTVILCPFGKVGSCSLPSTVTSIPEEAFECCSSLTSVTIPAGVTNIGSLAFSDCRSLRAVYFLGNAPSTGCFPFERATVYYLPGTTGWGSTFGGAPTALWLPQVQTSGVSFGVRTNQFGFNISWASGMVIVVEASTSLAHPVWTPLVTKTLAGGTAYFSDPQRTNYPARFYRITSP